MFSFTNVVHIIIIFQGTLLTAYILFTRKKRTNSELWLATLIGTLSVQMLGIFLANRDVGSTFFQNLNCIYGFLYGPLIFLYNRSITRTQFKLTRKDLFHFLPFSMVGLGIIVSNGSMCRPEVYIAYTLHVLLYVCFCFLEVQRYKRVVKDNYSRLEWLNLGWLQWVFVVFSLIVLVDVAQFILFLLGINTSFHENVVYLLILAAINLLYFNGFSSSRRSFGYNNEDLALSTVLSTRKRINTSLKENRLLIIRLEKHLVSTASFKNQNLTIAMLASELDIPKRTLSELINDHYDQHFVDFINTYRINCAKELFMNPTDPKETILEVLYEVGFNSKSSFNTAFKKKTGLTPSQFKSKYN